MSKRAEYQKYAEECLNMADQALRDSDKSTWLKLAGRWLRMIRVSPDQKASDTFDLVVRDKGTRQEKSLYEH
jgi:hypothetical protein